MDLVIMNDRVSFLGDVYHFTFTGVEGHHPLVFPFLESVRVLLES